MIDTFEISEFDGEPRIRDIDLAERLGFERPRDIRKIIERNMSEVEELGPARHRGALVTRPQGGTVIVQEYYLNEEQALLIAVLSRTEKARQVRAMLIRTFTAWRRSATTTVNLSGLIITLKPMIAEMVRQEIASAIPPPCPMQNDGIDRVLHAIRRYGGSATRAMIYQNLRNRFGVDELDWLLTTMVRDGILSVRPTRTGLGPGRLGVTYMSG